MFSLFQNLLFIELIYFRESYIYVFAKIDLQ